MNTLIDLESYPIADVLPTLLKDKTTKKNIIWATDSYMNYGGAYKDTAQITIVSLGLLPRGTLMPRVLKSSEQQSARTRAKAEVFTPSWIVNQMNNYADEEWFGHKGVFNTEAEHSWKTNHEEVMFPDDRTWKDYVLSKRLEITCGEAPFLVSRYDTTTGEALDVYDRIGMLDRKLRVVAENTDNKKDWMSWVTKAYQSTYGYEYQGDNLLLARINFIYTFVDYYEKKWGSLPDVSEIQKIANIVVWNLWQMDGLKGTIPGGALAVEFKQMSFDLFGDEKEESPDADTPCQIYDWRSRKTVLYINCSKEDI